VPAFLRGRERAARHPLVRRLTAIDKQVEEGVDRLRSPAADRVFYSLSSAADHGLLWLAIGAVGAAVSPKHRRRPFVRFALAMGVESALTNGVVKSPFRRVRPEDRLVGLPLPYGMHRPITSAFPSGHAASAFAAATVLSERSAAAPAYYLLAAGVATSRVYVRMHHTSDIVAGAAWGLVFGRVARRFVRWAG
jgi:undecaprenyl-diphosphatase